MEGSLTQAKYIQHSKISKHIQAVKLSFRNDL